MENGLVVDNLTVVRAGVPVVLGCSFAASSGDLVHLVGANGAGKSSLLLAIMGHSDCVVASGDMRFRDTSLLPLPTYERARRGIFLAHQEPPTLPGISIAGMIRASAEAMGVGLSVPEVQARIRTACEAVGVDEIFSRRFLGADLSGGEKKRAELIQLLALPPQAALLDEIDAGLDSAGRERLIAAIDTLRTGGTSVVFITHNPELADRLVPTSRVMLEKPVTDT